MGKQQIALLLSFAIPQFVWGAQILVRPNQAGRTSDVIAFSDTASSFSRPGVGFQVRLNLSCFSTNLRYVDNPISPYAAVKMEVDLATGTNFSVIFPGWLVMNDKLQVSMAPTLITYLAGVKNVFPAQSIKNTIIFDLPSTVSTGAYFDAAGKITNPNIYATAISRLEFQQDHTSSYGTPYAMKDLDRQQDTVKPWTIEKVMASLMTPLKWLPSLGFQKTFAGGGCCAPTDGGDGGPFKPDELVTLENHTDLGFQQPPVWVPGSGPEPAELKYFGRDGILTAHYEISWSSDFKTLNVNAAFPGQEGFCGGYFSPLMLFFTPEIPKFNYMTDFKMSSMTQRTTWPEPSSKAAFLVLDRNKDGIINDVTEMFGSEDNGTNGFDLLRVYDENEDGVIDAKDPIFSELRLWTDSTGTGKTLKKDLKTLKEAGVESISLGYDSSHFKSIGDQAEFRQRSSFVFTKNGKKTQGEVVDVWFKGSN